MPWWASRLPNSTHQPLSHRTSICCSLTSTHLYSFNESLTFVQVFVFISKQKLKCHLYYPFEITGLRYFLAHSFLDYWLHFGWINPFGSARSVILKTLWLLFHFDVHCGMLGGPREVRLAALQPSPLSFTPPPPAMGNETWAEPFLTG